MVDVLATPVSWVGMDVHMSSIAVAATVAGTGELRQVKLAGEVGQVSEVRVATIAEEGLRELVRAREDLRRDLMSTRHRVTKMLLRHGLRHPRVGRWGRDHRLWLGKVQLTDPAAQSAFFDLIGV